MTIWQLILRWVLPHKNLRKERIMMHDYEKRGLAGEGYFAILDALGLEYYSTVGDVLRTIESLKDNLKLKHESQEPPRKGRKSRRSLTAPDETPDPFAEADIPDDIA